MANSVDPDQTAPRSSLFWVHTVCFVSNARQLYAADDFSRRHFQMHFFLGALRVNFVLFQALRSVSWQHEGKQFMASHTDGSLTTWNIRASGKPCNIMTPHGKIDIVETA